MYININWHAVFFFTAFAHACMIQTKWGSIHKTALLVGVQRLTDLTINHALKRHSFVIVKAELHRVFLFSLSKRGH